MPKSPEEVLKGLRWEEDMKIVNDFDEHVWLKPLYVDADHNAVDPDTPGTRRLGITDCCFVSDPCPKHREMQQREDFENPN